MGELRPEDEAEGADSVVGDIELIDFLPSLFRHNFLKLLTDIRVALLEVLTMLASSSPVTESEENLLVAGRPCPSTGNTSEGALYAAEFTVQCAPTGTLVDDSATEGNLPKGSGDNGMGDGNSLSCFGGGIGG
jgi:hypothetical protein